MIFLLSTDLRTVTSVFTFVEETGALVWTSTDK